MHEPPNTGYWRIEDQIDWYDTRSRSAQRMFKLTKIGEIAIAASIIPAAQVSAILVSIFSVTLLVLQASQRLWNWHENWINYRSTCEGLKHEKYSFLSRSGPYTNLDDERARQLLAERTESLISREHTYWVAATFQSEKDTDAQQQQTLFPK